jgi:HSP20 family protein
MSRSTIRIRQLLFLPAVERLREPTWQPAADIYRTATGWVVKFDLAGVPPEEVELTAQGCRLTLKGSRRDCQQEEGCVCHLMEIDYSDFERTLVLPCELDHADISAEARHGMLIVRIRTERSL